MISQILHQLFFKAFTHIKWKLEAFISSLSIMSPLKVLYLKKEKNSTLVTNRKYFDNDRF